MCVCVCVCSARACTNTSISISVTNDTIAVLGALTPVDVNACEKNKPVFIT